MNEWGDYEISPYGRDYYPRLYTEEQPAVIDLVYISSIIALIGVLIAISIIAFRSLSKSSG